MTIGTTDIFLLVIIVSTLVVGFFWGALRSLLLLAGSPIDLGLIAAASLGLLLLAVLFLAIGLYTSVLSENPGVAAAGALDEIRHVATDLRVVGTYPTGSTNDYYREVSFGQYEVDGAAEGWHTASGTYASYENPDGSQDANTARQMIIDAIDQLDAHIRTPKIRRVGHQTSQGFGHRLEEGRQVIIAQFGNLCRAII